MQKDLNLNNLKVMPGKMLGEVLSNLETSAGGIIMASTIKEIPHKAHILKVGPAKRDKKGKLIQPCCKVGDITYFKKNFGYKWKEEKREFIFLENSHITGVDDDKT